MKTSTPLALPPAQQPFAPIRWNIDLGTHFRSEHYGDDFYRTFSSIEIARWRSSHWHGGLEVKMMEFNNSDEKAWKDGKDDEFTTVLKFTTKAGFKAAHRLLRILRAAYGDTTRRSPFTKVIIDVETAIEILPLLYKATFNHPFQIKCDANPGLLPHINANIDRLSA